MFEVKTETQLNISPGVDDPVLIGDDTIIEENVEGTNFGNTKIF